MGDDNYGVMGAGTKTKRNEIIYGWMGILINFGSKSKVKRHTLDYGV